MGSRKGDNKDRSPGEGTPRKRVILFQAAREVEFVTFCKPFVPLGFNLVPKEKRGQHWSEELHFGRIRNRAISYWRSGQCKSGMSASNRPSPTSKVGAQACPARKEKLERQTPSKRNNKERKMIEKTPVSFPFKGQKTTEGGRKRLHQGNQLSGKGSRSLSAGCQGPRHEHPVHAERWKRMPGVGVLGTSH